MIRLNYQHWLRFYARHGRRLWRESARATPHLSPATRLRHILEGFHPAEGDWYRQAGIDPSLCLSNAHRETVLHGLNGRHAVYLNDKLVFAHGLEVAGLPHPRVFGHSHAGHWHWRDGGPDAFARSIAEEGRGVIKPIRGSKGETVQFLDAWTPDCKPWRDDLIATRFVRQADYAAAIFPDAVNTIRVITLNPTGDDPFVAAAAHRFGAAGSGGLDNFAVGGVAARVDLSSGRLGRGFRIGPGNRLEWLDHHPDTGTPLEGVQVPAWREVLDLVRALCATFPFLPYVGWDVAVSREGPVVIEGNAHPGLKLFEVYGPLMADPEVASRFTQLARHKRAA